MHVSISCTSCLLIQRPTFSMSIRAPRTSKTSSGRSGSSSFLCCRFLTIALISVDVTFLPRPHFLNRDLY